METLFDSVVTCYKRNNYKKELKDNLAGFDLSLHEKEGYGGRGTVEVCTSYLSMSVEDKVELLKGFLRYDRMALNGYDIYITGHIFFKCGSYIKFESYGDDIYETPHYYKHIEMPKNL